MEGVPRKFTRSIQLDDYSCGAHSVKMVLSHFGYSARIGALKKELETTKDGTSIKAMRRALKARDLTVERRKHMSLLELQEVIDSGAVAIVDVDNDHYAVCHGMRKSRKIIYLADPSVIRMKGFSLSRKRFKKRWQRSAIVVWE